MAAELDHTTVRKAYDRWAPVYDVVFGAVFDQGRRLAVAAAERVGGRILEVGVGTGITLPRYSRSNEITGIDLSAPMLQRAQKRVDEFGLHNVVRLDVMDAEHLAFPDASFDVVAAHHVVSTCPHPHDALDEFVRVVKPGGEIILVSRIGAEAGPRRVAEQMLQPVVRHLGWRSEFPWDRYAVWLARRPDVRLIERRAVPPFGHFSLVRFAKA
jgi:phosphatidylethanolamine/phosphatidyl-N-methylethanolamine N-methyltransferase